MTKQVASPNGAQYMFYDDGCGCTAELTFYKVLGGVLMVFSLEQDDCWRESCFESIQGVIKSGEYQNYVELGA